MQSISNEMERQDLFCLKHHFVLERMLKTMMYGVDKQAYNH